MFPGRQMQEKGLRVRAVLCGVLLSLLGGLPVMAHALEQDSQVPFTDELTWHEAVQIAVNRHPTVLAAQATVRQQSSLTDAARAGYRPRVQAEVTAGEQGEFGTGQVATVGVTQMLYDFGKTSSAVERENAGERRERAALLQAVDEVLEGTLQAMIEIHRHEALRVMI